MKRKIWIIVCLVALLTGLAVLSLGQAPQFTISSTVPLNYTGNDLTSASIFAWQEFVALNWPNQMSNGVVTQRGTPSTQPFGTPGVPLVWHTFRGKVEIFPGNGKPPNGYQNNSKVSYGFDAPPAYNYSSTINACSGPNPAQPAWINLDETTQIGLAAMYAGNLAGYQPPYVNSAPKLIRFMAKANRQDYVYVAGNQWYGGVPSLINTNTIAYIQTNKRDPPPGSTNLVSFLNNTIEMKAAFRPLGPGDNPSHFYSTKVRYYEPSGSGYCFVEDTWALIGLHIIQKTANSPFFVYATFEQAENILTTGGQPTEDVNGKVIVPPSGPPTNPQVSFKDSNQAFAKTPVYPTVSTVPAQAPYCPSTVGGNPNKQLYYIELANKDNPPLVPAGGPICQVSRDNPIPPEVINVNVAAHAAIAQYTKQNGVTSPWGYYKLINVQYVPINKTTPGTPYTGKNRGTYYQSNSVIETDYTLQMFSTALFAPPPPSTLFGPPTDYNASTSQVPEPPFSNVYFNGTANAMGGCMGCHGNAQVAGNDFSFILELGPVLTPQTPANADALAARALYRKIFTRPAH